MTKLEAVNRMLEALGEPAVDAISSDDDLATAAESILDDENRRIQRQGWAVNSEYAVELEPDGSDEIVLDADVIRFTVAGRSRRRRIVPKGGKLFDQDENSATFTDSVFADLVKLLDFADIPSEAETLAEYIATSAAVRLVRTRMGNSEVDQHALQALAQAKLDAEQEDGDLRNTQLLHTDEARLIKGNRYDWYAKRTGGML